MPDATRHANPDATLDTCLAGAAALALERFAFLLVEPLDPAAAVDWNDTVAAAVDFHGPRHGRLAVRVARASLPSIAASMLGADEPPPHALQLDALGELANVICGEVLPTLAGPSAVFALTPPVVGAPWTSLIEGDAQGAAPAPCIARAILDLEGAPAEVVWLAS